MRTTVILDPEVAQQIKGLVAESRLSMRKVINNLLRKGLAGGKSPQAAGLYAVHPFESGTPAGIISGRFNQLYDELESEQFSRERPEAVHETPVKHSGANLRRRKK
jgi:hypothetical protein